MQREHSVTQNPPCRHLRRTAAWLLGAATAVLATTGCADRSHQIVVSVPEQRMILLKDGVPLAIYQVSTSRFGLGDIPGHNGTPLGSLEVAEKIGDGAPLGAVFKSRHPTGEIIRADAPGRDPVVTRILWLRGLQAENAHAYDRCIYIHGTPEERYIGAPKSYGCIRMRSRDVVMLHDEVGKGTRVDIRNAPLVAAASRYIVPEAVIPPVRLADSPTVLLPTSQSNDPAANTERKLR